ncbi:MAG: homoserine O-acetyltransferase family protein [Candidatus Cyclobacteriaceae bacterium M3_2C_046]
MIKKSVFEYKHRFELESGKILPEFQLTYSTWGRLNQQKNNVVWICHAFSGGSDFTAWWPEMVGLGKTFDPSENFIIGVNMLGSCYGSTGPLSINPDTGQKYYHEFPQVTNRDIIRSFDLLRQDLGISQIDALVGVSLGGQQALEWLIEKPFLFRNAIIMGANAQHSAWGIAFNQTQRSAISQDLTWPLHTDEAGLDGLKIARSIAMLSYRNYSIYQEKQFEPDSDKTDGFKATTYQQYLGEKLADRFNAFSYWVLSKAMDSHNVGRNRNGCARALNQIKANCLVIGIKQDLLFPLVEQEYLVQHIYQAQLLAIDSDYGHDGFLLETQKLDDSVKKFFRRYTYKSMAV